MWCLIVSIPDLCPLSYFEKQCLLFEWPFKTGFTVQRKIHFSAKCISSRIAIAVTYHALFRLTVHQIKMFACEVKKSRVFA